MIAIARGITRFDGRSAFTTWCYRVATNAALDELRRKHAGGRSPPTPTHPSRWRPRRTRPTSWPRGLDIDAALRHVPEEFRVAVVLRDLCDLDYAEIAEVLDIPPGTVRSRISRGRAILVERLGSEHRLGDTPGTRCPPPNVRTTMADDDDAPTTRDVESRTARGGAARRGDPSPPGRTAMRSTATARRPPRSLARAWQWLVAAAAVVVVLVVGGAPAADLRRRRTSDRRRARATASRHHAPKARSSRPTSATTAISTDAGRTSTAAAAAALGLARLGDAAATAAPQRRPATPRTGCSAAAGGSTAESAGDTVERSRACAAPPQPRRAAPIVAHRLRDHRRPHARPSCCVEAGRRHAFARRRARRSVRALRLA